MTTDLNDKLIKKFRIFRISNDFPLTKGRPIRTDFPRTLILDIETASQGSQISISAPLILFSAKLFLNLMY